MSTPTTSRAKNFADKLPWTVFWALSGQAIFSITRFLSSVVVGGRFGSGGEAELGYYGAAFGVVLLIISLHEAFVTTPLNVFMTRQDTAVQSRFSANMLLVSIGLIAIVTSAMLAICLTQYQLQIISPELATAMLAVSLLVPTQLLREFSRRWLLAQIKPKQATMFDGLFAAIFLSALFGLVAAANVSATNVFAALAIANLLSLVIWWGTYRSGFSFAANPEARFIDQARANVRYGRWVAGENLCSVVTMYFCHWFLFAKLSDVHAGVFTACTTTVFLANPFLLGVSGIMAPRAAQEFNRTGWVAMSRVLLRYGGLIFVTLTGFSISLFFLGDYMTALFFGGKYSDFFRQYYDGKNNVTFVISLMMPMLGISYTMAVGLLSAHLPHHSFYAAIVGLVVTVAANFSFPDPSLMTAATSMVIAGAAMTCYRAAAFFLCRHAGLKEEQAALLASDSN